MEAALAKHSRQDTITHFTLNRIKFENDEKKCNENQIERENTPNLQLHVKIAKCMCRRKIIPHRETFIK